MNSLVSSTGSIKKNNVQGRTIPRINKKVFFNSLCINKKIIEQNIKAFTYVPISNHQRNEIKEKLPTKINL